METVNSGRGGQPRVLDGPRLVIVGGPRSFSTQIGIHEIEFGCDIVVFRLQIDVPRSVAICTHAQLKKKCNKKSFTISFFKILTLKTDLNANWMLNLQQLS